MQTTLDLKSHVLVGFRKPKLWQFAYLDKAIPAQLFKIHFCTAKAHRSKNIKQNEGKIDGDSSKKKVVAVINGCAKIWQLRCYRCYTHGKKDQHTPKTKPRTQHSVWSTVGMVTMHAN